MREKPELDDQQRFNKVWSYLVETVEDKILTIHAEAQRRVLRASVRGFDALPPERRDRVAYVFDGMMVEHHEGCDPEAGDREADDALIEAGWEAEEWGVAYTIVEKPLYGLPQIDPDDFESAKGARRALEEAKQA